MSEHVQSAELAPLTEAEREVIRKAIVADLAGVPATADHAEWIAWWLMNGWPRKTPPAIAGIFAARRIPPEGDVR